MESLFVYILGGWSICMIGYIALSNIKKYNNRNYYDLSDKIIKYKRIKEKTNIKK